MTEEDNDFAGVNCCIHKMKLLSCYLLRGIGAIVAASILVCVSLCALLIVAAVPYHYDAQQLDGFYRKQMAVDQRLGQACEITCFRQPSRIPTDREAPRIFYISLL